MWIKSCGPPISATWWSSDSAIPMRLLFFWLLFGGDFCSPGVRFRICHDLAQAATQPIALTIVFRSHFGSSLALASLQGESPVAAKQITLTPFLFENELPITFSTSVIYRYKCRRRRDGQLQPKLIRSCQCRHFCQSVGLDCFNCCARSQRQRTAWS